MTATTIRAHVKSCSAPAGTRLGRGRGSCRRYVEGEAAGGKRAGLAEDRVPAPGEPRGGVHELLREARIEDALRADLGVDVGKRVAAPAGRLEALHVRGEAGVAHRLLARLREDEVEEQLRRRRARRLPRHPDPARND